MAHLNKVLTGNEISADQRIGIDAGIVILDYVDEASGQMVERPDGSGEFTRVVLRPRMIITDPSRIEDAVAIHGRVHEVCAISRSVTFAVDCEPVVTAAESPS